LKENSLFFLKILKKQKPFDRLVGLSVELLENHRTDQTSRSNRFSEQLNKFYSFFLKKRRFKIEKAASTKTSN